MSTFSDRIREVARDKGLKKPAFQSSLPSIQQQLETQATGKAAPVATSGQSNIAEQAAVAAVPTNAPALQAAGEQMAAVEQSDQLKQQAGDAQREQARKAMESRNQQAIADLLSNTTSSEKELELREDQQQLEQAAAQLRLSDREYMADLQRTARENQITDSVSFAETAQRELIGQNLDKVLQEINFSEDMARRGRAGRIEDVIADINSANAILEAQMRDTRRAQTIGGIIDLGKAGIQAADAAGAFEETDNVASNPTEYSGPATPSTASDVNKARGY